MAESVRTKHLEVMERLLPDADLVGYVAGRTGPDPVLVMAGLFVAWALGAVLFAVTTGGIFLIGIPPLLILHYYLSPPRGVAVTLDTVVVVGRGLWLSRPKTVLVTENRREVEPEKASGSRVLVRIGDERVWFSKGEEAEFRRLMAVAASGNRIPKRNIGPPPETDDPHGLLDGPLPGPPPPEPGGVGRRRGPAG